MFKLPLSSYSNKSFYKRVVTHSGSFKVLEDLRRLSYFLIQNSFKVFKPYDRCLMRFIYIVLYIL